MSNTQKRPAVRHVPAHRAQGLDEAVTAQPRPVADELALEASAEPELSVDPEDLGSRFLSDAVEQGDFNPDQPWPDDSSLSDDAELSLLDREGKTGDDTIPSDIGPEDLDEQGSHTRLAAGSEPEPRANDRPRHSDMRPKAPLKAAAHTLLDRGTGLLRRVAHRLQRYGT